MTVIAIKNESEFDEQIAKGGPVFVDFFAEWCGPCKMVAPKLEAFSEKLPGVTFLKVDVDECQDLAQKYKISAMPTFIAFNKGKKVEQIVGADLAKIESITQQLNKSSAGQQQPAMAAA